MIWCEITGNCNASVGDSFSQPLFTIYPAQMEREKPLTLIFVVIFRLKLMESSL